MPTHIGVWDTVDVEMLARWSDLDIVHATKTLHHVESRVFLKAMRREIASVRADVSAALLEHLADLV
jgi:hypothetical protein